MQHSAFSISFLQGCVIQKLLNQIHMGKEHSAAAVSLQAKGIQGISINEQQLKNITDEVSQNHLEAFPKQHTDYFELSHRGKFVCSSDRQKFSMYC